MLLVTGSAGHLGEGLMRTLRAAGRPVLGIDLKPSPFTDRVGSILDPGFVAGALDGVRAVIHAATLHKPHVATHAQRAFLDTNVTGTLTLLEAAVSAGVGSFVITSTTSAFGAALTPVPGAPAAWIDEDVVPVPRNIYGTTKLAAEALCELFARRDRLPLVVLRTARFFPEPDDDPEKAAAYPLANIQANELLYRRADIADVAEAHLCAVDRAPALGFARFIVSAPTPFARAELPELRRDAPAVVARHFPDQPALYAARGWRMFPSVDRVYDSRRAVEALGWHPRTGFADVLASLRAGRDFASPLARAVGSKGYHQPASNG
ncbi:MAG: NAD(P)-dependent oxidoreductase [Amaricoccus sp.]